MGGVKCWTLDRPGDSGGVLAEARVVFEPDLVHHANLPPRDTFNSDRLKRVSQNLRFQTSGFGIRVLGFGIRVSSFSIWVSGDGSGLSDISGPSHQPASQENIRQKGDLGFGIRVSGFGFHVFG